MNILTKENIRIGLKIKPIKENVALTIVANYKEIDYGLVFSINKEFFDVILIKGNQHINTRTECFISARTKRPLFEICDLSDSEEEQDINIASKEKNEIWNCALEKVIDESMNLIDSHKIDIFIDKIENLKK